MSSIFKKIRSIKENGIEPLSQGMNYYNQPTVAMEKKANERSVICEGCVNFVKEPISFLRVQDLRIPILNNKMCDECGCASPYLLRQNVKICKLWEDDKI